MTIPTCPSANSRGSGDECDDPPRALLLDASRLAAKAIVLLAQIFSEQRVELVPDRLECLEWTDPSRGECTPEVWDAERRIGLTAQHGLARGLVGADEAGDRGQRIGLWLAQTEVAHR